MLYLPCQAPSKDLKAVKGIGFPETPLDDNRHFTEKGAKRWARVFLLLSSAGNLEIHSESMSQVDGLTVRTPI